MGNNKKFGLFSIILLGINSIIGSGIFLLPGKAYTFMGTSSLFVYIFITLLAGSIALCFAEVAGLFKSNGAAYIYAKQAFGDFVGFEVGFMKYFVQTIAWATMANGFATAIGNDAMKPYIIIGLIALLTIINLIGVDLIKYLNNVSTIAKLVPLLLFVAVGVFFVNFDNFKPLVPEGGITAGTFAGASILIFYAFTGFESIATASEDMENPKRNIPIAIACAIGIVAVIYFLVQFVSIGTLGATLTDNKTPVADAMATFMGSWGGKLVTVGTLISIGAINIAASFHNPRGFLALGERNMLPAFVLAKTPWGTPAVAIIVSGVLSCGVALSGTFTELAAISVISRFSQYIPTCLSVLVFRARGLKSTFRIPFGPVFPIVATVVSIYLLAQSDFKKIIIGLGAMIILVPFYFIMQWYNKRQGRTFTDAE